MVLGLRSKHKRGASIQVEYLIQVQEISPWPAKASSASSLVLQWENGDQSYGSLVCGVVEGKVESSDLFRLSVTLCKETSKKGGESFAKNLLEFYLFEQKKDKSSKGHQLGSAVLNLADYGIVNEGITVSAPVSLKKSSKSAPQPMLYVSIQPFEKDGSNTSLSKEASLDKDASESVSEVTNDYEEEIASFTDDDVDHADGNSSTALDSSRRASPSQSDKNVATSTLANTRRADEGPALASSVTASPVIRADEPIQVEKTSNRSSIDEYQSASQSDKNVAASKITNTTRANENVALPSSVTASPVIQAEERVRVEKTSNRPSIEEYRTIKEPDAKERIEEAKVPDLADGDHAVNTVESHLKVNGQEIEEKLHGEVRRDATRNQLPLRSNTISSNRHAVGGNTRRDKLKQLKSIQIQNAAASESERPLGNGQPTERVKRHEVAERVSRGGVITDQGGQKEEKPNLVENSSKMRSESENERSLRNGHSTERVKRLEAAEKVNRGGTITDQIVDLNTVKVRSEPDMVVKKEEPSKVASSDSVLKSASPRNESSTVKTPPAQRPKRVESSKNAKNGGMSHSPSGREETKSVSGNKVEMLEEELMETAALEIGLYSVVAEHGSSATKVHAPARRLSRFYLHACKARNQAKKANAARAITSGLILVSKACGNDVPRLTFWLSNSIVLRSIVSQAVEKLNRGPGSSPSKQSKPTISDEWENPRTFVIALEKVEAWIFSRIVESVWWQTLTPHMQSTAVKGSGSKKAHAHARKHGLGDQEQGNFAIDLWQRAFKDACERLCPIRAGGHECGCLHVLARLVMEQLVARLDVAMFNAVLRESADEMPTDPVSDPISDPKVLPIPAGKSSFGAGAQLKNAVGSWSRWLTDLFGIDDCESPEDNDTPFKIFHLLNALSDLMMLPFEMLADQSTRKEVCPTFGPPLIRHILCSFVPDEFNPDPIPNSILDTLDSEDTAESDEDESLTSFPCTARATVYLPPKAASIAKTIGGEAGGQNSSSALQRSGSTLLRKSYTSDDELEELDSPLNSIVVVDKLASASSSSSSASLTGKGGRKVVRYQLLREVWKDSQ
ncbi:hypothetical protein LINGRAHAP2_LOCUS18311 [Linum grandiflorum]